PQRHPQSAFLPGGNGRQAAIRAYSRQMGESDPVGWLAILTINCPCFPWFGKKQSRVGERGESQQLRRPHLDITCVCRSRNSNSAREWRSNTCNTIANSCCN